MFERSDRGSADPVGVLAEPEETKGSHKTYYRTGADGRTLVGVVVLGKSEVARGTLRSILAQLEIDPDDFCAAL